MYSVAEGMDVKERKGSISRSALEICQQVIRFSAFDREVVVREDRAL